MKVSDLIAQGEIEEQKAREAAEKARTKAKARAKVFERLDGLVTEIDQGFLLKDWVRKDRAVVRILALTRHEARKGGKPKFRFRYAFFACRAFEALQRDDLVRLRPAFLVELDRCLGDLDLPDWLTKSIQRIQARTASAHAAGVHKTLARSAQPKKSGGDRRRPGSQKARQEKLSTPERNPQMEEALKAAGVVGEEKDDNIVSIAA